MSEPGHDDHPASISEMVTRFQVPLITLLPINSLAIEDVDIKFEVDVHTHHEVPEERDRLFGDVSSAPTTHELVGSIKHVHDKTEGAQAGGPGASPVSISISARKLPLPLGVSTLIQAYSKAIHPSDA